MNAVPTLDIRGFDELSSRAAFVAELGAAYREFGFCCVRGHGIPAKLIDEVYAAFRRFFALPEVVKRRYHQPGGGGARGYTPFKIETARDSAHADLKEFWHIGRELAHGAAEAVSMPPNRWPAEVPELRGAAYALYESLDALGGRVLSALALDLGLDEDFFVARTDRGNSILRALHYPPIEDAAAPNLRSGEHEDINLITLLVGASAEGLEIRTRSGAWLPVTTQDEAIVINIGDMLQRISNRLYPSTRHRVTNPRGEAGRRARYSMPFFLHPNPDVLLEVLPQCISEARPDPHVEPITAHAYLMQRLREIKLL